MNQTTLRKTLTHQFTRASAWLLLMLVVAAPFALAQEGRVVREKVHGASLVGNVTGEETTRQVSVYLPPGYDGAPEKRYPVVYLLHGIGGTDKDFTSAWKGQTEAWGTLRGLMNNGVAERRFGEMIVVMPDQRTKMMGSFYTNSAATGNWEDFTAKDLVNFIDRKYRTLARAESRGLAGHSMGGHGAIKVGMKHPEVFSVVYAMNPAVLGWGNDISLENPRFVALFKMTTLEEVFRGGIYSIGGLCVAQAFSPNPNRPPFYADLPYKLIDGKPQPSEPAYTRWTENMPLHMAAKYRANLLRLRGLRFDTGWEDEFTHIPPTTRAFARKLTELGIEHIFEEYNGDHRNRMWGRTGRLYTEVLPYFWLLLDAREQ